MKIQQIVQDTEWQALREGFVGTWKVSPKQNCIILRKYLDDYKDPLKIRRVLNYLTGTAFRTGKIQHQDITDLISDIKKNRIITSKLKVT